jgi:hypothetical protein
MPVPSRPPEGAGFPLSAIVTPKVLIVRGTSFRRQAWCENPLQLKTAVVRRHHYECVAAGYGACDALEWNEKRSRGLREMNYQSAAAPRKSPRSLGSNVLNCQSYSRIGRSLGQQPFVCQRQAIR